MDAMEVRSDGSNTPSSSRSTLQLAHHFCFYCIAYCVVLLSFFTCIFILWDLIHWVWLEEVLTLDMYLYLWSILLWRPFHAPAKIMLESMSNKGFEELTANKRYSNVWMCKKQNQLGLKKAWYCYRFNNLVISAVHKRKTKMQLKCRTINRHFVIFCWSANVLLPRENMGPEWRHVCCSGVIPIWLNPELHLALPKEYFLNFVFAENSKSPPVLSQE